MKYKQQIKKTFAIVKITKETYNDLIEIMRKEEIKNPYLKGILSLNSVIKMLLLKRRIRLSKYRYIIKELKRR